MLNKAFSGGVSMSLILAACVATSGCVYERYVGGEGGAGGEGGHAVIETVQGPGGCDSGAGGHEVGGGPATNPGAGGHEVGGGPATGEGGFGGGGTSEGGFGGGGTSEGGFGGGGTGEGGQGGAAQCLGCAEYITEPGDLDLCSTSVAVYDALVTCVCDTGCAALCLDNVCAGMEASLECQDCVLDKVQGCGLQFEDCSNDL